jgi:hypothetical protein
MTRIAQLPFVIVAVAGFAAAGAWTVRVACADYWYGQETAAGTERAIAITPGQAAYYYRLSLLDADDAPEKAAAALRRAVALNPADAHSWIDLGLQYETAGDDANAERCLLRAAEESAEFLPQWTLANYYSRRGDAQQFWYWARRAAAMAYDATALFRLCDQMEPGTNLIDRLEIRRAAVRASYLGYVLGVDKAELIAAPAREVFTDGREDDTPLLMEATDHLLRWNRPGEAIELWNKLAGARRIPFHAFNANGRELVTNGGFATSPVSRGLDWHLNETDGIDAASEDNPGGLRITFSGRQPEACEPLYEYVPVEENRTYAVRVQYHTSGIAKGTGLAWQVTDASGESIGQGRDLSSDSDAWDTSTFTAPAGCRLVRLSLIYRRALGTTRINGYVVLRAVSLGPAR